MTLWDRATDVVVLGSGCAGLTAALAAGTNGAAVELCEQASTIGGMTAISAGVAWIPAHDRAPDLTIADALAYIRSQSTGGLDDELVDSFVRGGPTLLDFLEANTNLRFRVVPGITDFRPEAPGGKLGGRSLVPADYAADIGEWTTRLTSPPSANGGVGYDVNSGERRSGHGGATLVAGLLEGVLAAGGTVTSDARARELVTAGGRVLGVRVEQANDPVSIRARRGVVLATGGFEWDSSLLTTFLKGPSHVSAWPPFNRGDGLRMAMAAGAQLGNMSEAWWMPAIDIDDDLEPNGRPRGWGFGQERSRPGSIMVNRLGKRFVNEAGPWDSLAGAFHRLDPKLGYVNHPAWVVFDSGHLAAYGAFGLRAHVKLPEWFNRSPTLDALALRLGIGADSLIDTVERWNRSAVAGSDPEFGRGASEFDYWFGDRSAATKAGRTLGPVIDPPFYAVPTTIGVIGTKGGPRTDGDGRVRHVLGGTIPHLFAAGNAMAVATGSAYGGLGGTIGPALVSGHRAGVAAARTTDV